MRLTWRNLKRTNKKRNKLNNRLLVRKYKNRPMKIIMMRISNKALNKPLIQMNRAIIRPPTAKKQLRNKKSSQRSLNN